MNHINEDKLLEYALDIHTDEAERTEIEIHIGDCSECRGKLEAIRNDINTIGGIRGNKKAIPFPITHRKKSFARAIIKIAALFIFGLFTGLGISSLTDREPINVIPSYLKLSPPADSLTGYVASDATKINQDYYEQILED